MTARSALAACSSPTMRAGRFSGGYISMRSRRPRAPAPSWPGSQLLLTQLLAQSLALLGRSLLPALAKLLPLLRRQGLPAREVLVHALALFRCHGLVPAQALLDPLLALGGQPLKALVGPLQLLLARLPELVPALEILDDAGALVRRHLAEALEVLTGRLPVLGRQALPVPVVLEHALTLVGRELLPPLQVALDDRPLLAAEPVHAPQPLAPPHFH